MAYPAVICLMNTAYRLLYSSDRISFPYENCRTFLRRTFIASDDLRDALKNNDEKRRNIVCLSERVMRLEAEVREAASNLEDAIESRVYTQIQSQSEGDPIPPVFSIDLREIHDQLQRFLSMAERMEAAYQEDNDEAEVLPVPPIYFEGGDPSKMVGVTDKFHSLKNILFDSLGFRNLAIYGMAGIGKTTLAKKILEDPEIKEIFNCRVFVAVGLEPKVNYESQFKRVLQAILAQVKPDCDAAVMAEVENSDKSFWERLIDEKTLIVLDDVWSEEMWPQLRRIFPSEPNGCTMLATSRIRRLGFSIQSLPQDMRFMNKEESWELLRVRVFGEEKCIPDELEKAGKKIAENCEGLPLLLIALADQLYSAERTPEFWNMVAADKENHIFVNAYDQISEVILPNFYNLPQNIKPSFLYLRIFPQNHRFRCSRLTKLSCGEDFFHSSHSSQTKHLADSHLYELSINNVLLVHRESEWHGVKVYSLHSAFWYPCKKLAENIKILQTFNRYADASAESIRGQRRLAIYKNVLLGIKHIYNSVASVPNARSLLCTGACHPYQVPLCLGYLRLLRVLDALSIRFYVFPVEVVQLILLRYLSLTFNGNLSPLISKLWNLQCLIVHKHLSINYTLAESYLPLEIWDLHELRYLEIMGRNLPDPPPGASLPALTNLLDVDAHSCTEAVLQSIPQLEKLRVQIELAPDAAQCLTCLDHISHPPKLESFQCIVKNPMIVAPPPLPIFGSSLKKLTLRGFGYPWKEMYKIAGLPSLKVLKLQCYAFRGPEWEAEKGFQKLEYLLIEDTDLVQWSSNQGTFPSLRFLTAKDCYRLQKIPYLSAIEEIKLVDCNPAVLTCVEQLEANFDDCEVSASYSWEKGNLKQ